MAEVSIPSISASRRRTRTYDAQADHTALFSAIVDLLCPAGTLIARASADDAGDGWILCDGRSLLKANYPRLYAMIGGMFSEDATTFALPDLAGKILIGAGGAAGVIPLTTSGSHLLTLTVDNLPAHDHALTDPGHGHTFTGTPHSHTVTDPGHDHSAVTAVATSAAAGADVSAVTSGDTGSATTGISIGNATAAGSISDETTGITMSTTGLGAPATILPPVLAIYWFIRS